MVRPLVTLYCCVRGAAFEQYAARMWEGAREHFLPGACEYVQLPAEQGWPMASTNRYTVALRHKEWLTGEYVFQIDADMVIEAPVGHEILADGITVTTHPGYPPGSADAPYERNLESAAGVAHGAEGSQYFPGAFEGGQRDHFFAMAEWIAAASRTDQRLGIEPVWNDESYLNRYLIDHPPAKVLDRRYCWWDHWGTSDERIIVHLDKTQHEFDTRGE